MSAPGTDRSKSSAQTPSPRPALRRSGGVFGSAVSVLDQALQGLLSHPLRSALTMLSVTFGASVLVVLVSYASGVPEITADVLRSLGGREFIVEPRRSWGPGGSRGGRQLRIRYADLPAIREACPSIADMAPTYRPGMGGPVFSEERSWPWASLTGVGHSYRDVTELRITAGRWFTEAEELGSEDVVLLSRPLVDGMFDGRTPLGESVDAWGQRFTVIGVFESVASFAYSLFVPYPTAMQMGDSGGRYVSQIAFAPRRADLAAEAIAEIRAALGALYSFDPEDTRALDVRENTAFVAQVEAVSMGLEGLVLTIAVLALVLGCLGAANVVGISVAERTAEIGLRKALGAGQARIRAEVLTETLMLCLAGGAVGVALAVAVLRGLGPLPFSDDALLEPNLDPASLGLAVALLVITATLAGLPAALRASRLDPVEALRSE